MSSSEQMDLSLNDGSGGFFRDLTSILGQLLAKPCSELDPDQLNELNSFLGQTNEALRNGQIDDEPGAVNEIFQIAAMTSKLCLGFNEATSSNEAILAQLKDIFYLANELFTGALSLCNSLNIAITQLGEMLNFVKNCQKIDVKLFLQTAKSFSSVADKTRAIDFVDFLQSTIFSEYLTSSKRTPTTIKVTGFVLKNLTSLYANFGPDLLVEAENIRKTAKFLIDLHAVYIDIASKSEAETLTNAFAQFVMVSFQPLLLPLLRHESFLSELAELNFAELTSVSKTAWLALVVNIFTVMSDSKIISQTNNVHEVLEAFLRNFCDWAVDEKASQQWPWPIVGSLKAQSANELGAFSVAKLVLRSTLEEASCFFLFEQLLLLALTGKSDKSYPILARVLVSDILTFMTKFSLRLAIRYISLLGQFVAKSGENDEAATFLVPTLMRRIFDTISDDQKAKIVEQSLGELVHSFPNVIQSKRQSSGVYSMTEAFRMLESCTNAVLTRTPSPVNLLTVTVRLYAYLTWWTSSSPEMLRSCKGLLEKVTFSMWEILSMTVPESESSRCLLVLFAQAVFEASKASIIGVNNYENSAKFWAAAGQFFEIASLPVSLKELFVVWLLKVVDSNTLAYSQGAQKIVENSLLLDAESTSLVHGVVLANLASRLNLKGGTTASMLMARLNPKLRIQAEAFSQQLFCIPFSKLA